MDRGMEARTAKVVVSYSAWLVLLVASGVLLIRGDDLQAAGVVPWFAAMFAAMAGGDQLESLRRQRLGRYVAQLAFVTMGILLVVALAAGPPSYVAALGQRGTAVVTEVDLEVEPDEIYRRCRVSLAATQQDLGWLPGEQCGFRVPGDHIPVSYDPRGWTVTMATNGLPARHTGAMVMLVWLLAATGTAATAITVTAADPPWPAPGSAP